MPEDHSPTAAHITTPTEYDFPQPGYSQPNYPQQYTSDASQVPLAAQMTTPTSYPNYGIQFVTPSAWHEVVASTADTYRTNSKRRWDPSEGGLPLGKHITWTPFGQSNIWLWYILGISPSFSTQGIIPSAWRRYQIRWDDSTHRPISTLLWDMRKLRPVVSLSREVRFARERFYEAHLYRDTKNERQYVNKKPYQTQHFTLCMFLNLYISSKP
jgi:hypothetical protein